MIEAKKAGPAPWGGLPCAFLWSLVTGYDEEAGTYTGNHAGAGTFTIGWDAFGHSDPVNWLSVMIFRPLTEPFAAAGASRKAVEHAIGSSQGKHPGMPQPRDWRIGDVARCLPKRTVSVHGVSRHADFLVGARRDAAAWLREIEPTSGKRRAPLPRRCRQLRRGGGPNLGVARPVCRGISGPAPGGGGGGIRTSALAANGRSWRVCNRPWRRSRGSPVGKVSPSEIRTTPSCVGLGYPGDLPTRKRLEGVGGVNGHSCFDHLDSTLNSP